MVINPQFDYAGEFSEGLAMVKVGDKWGYIDKTGEMVINPQFDCPPHFNADANADAVEFSEGLAPIKISDKWGYTDKTGEMVIKSSV